MKDLITNKSKKVLTAKIEEAIESVEVNIDIKKLSKIIQDIVDRTVVDIMRDRAVYSLIKKAVKGHIVGMDITFSSEPEEPNRKLPRKMDARQEE